LLVGLEAAGLIIEFLGQSAKDRAGALVKLAVGQAAAMLGLMPKLQWSIVHANQTHIC
jgi:hypothetical protein